MPLSFNRKLNLEEPRLITIILVGVDCSEDSEKDVSAASSIWIPPRSINYPLVINDLKKMHEIVLSKVATEKGRAN